MMMRLALVIGVLGCGSLAAAQPSAEPAAVVRDEGSSLADAQMLFYRGRYEEAATAARALFGDTSANLAAYELRSSALHFQIKRALGDAKDRGKAFQACASCPDVMASFLADIRAGQAAARQRLARSAADEEALFFLGKLDLNYVWLHLGTIGRKTGWSEYWEARRSLDAVLAQNPQHIRAKVARAWIDYIVDTRMPLGTRWVLGGGDKKRGLRAIAEAAGAPTDFFTGAEARFALWELQVREKRIPDALIVARQLLADFPDNADLIKFVATSGSVTRSNDRD